MQNTPIKVAAVQMVSTPDVQENFASARRLVAEAAQQGAQLVLLPEYWPVMGMREEDKIGLAEELDGGPIQRFMAELAREHRIWLIGGTLPLAAPGSRQGDERDAGVRPGWRHGVALRQDPPVQFHQGRGILRRVEDHRARQGCHGVLRALRRRRPVGLLRLALSRSCTAPWGRYR